jgi:copper chaperone CopZ
MGLGQLPLNCKNYVINDLPQLGFSIRSDEMKKIIMLTGLGLALSSQILAARIDVDVKGMTCGMCVEAITKELKMTDKVEKIQVSLENKKATFDEMKGKKISDTEIKAAIKKAGYEVDKIQRR